MAAFEEAVRFLDTLGVWDMILPFILVFTVVYAVLQRTKVLGTEKGEPKKRINAMAAFLIGFFVLISVDVLHVINVIAQYFVVIIVGFMVVALILGLFGFRGFSKNITLALGTIAVGAIALYSFGYLGIISLPALRKFFETPIIAALVMIFLVWFILRKSAAEKTGKTSKHEKPAKEAAEKGKPAEGGAPASKRQQAQHEVPDEPAEWVRRKKITRPSGREED